MHALAVAVVEFGVFGSNHMGEVIEPETKFKFSTGAFWLGVILAFYLFSSGPITRWFPAVADKIYAPLRPLVSSEMFSKPLRGWLSLWGVDVGQTLRAPAGGAVLVNTDAGVLMISNNPSGGTVIITNFGGLLIATNALTNSGHTNSTVHLAPARAE